MNKKIKEKWVEALKSNKYKQGCLYLRSENDSYCCLGVLCDIVDPSKWIKGCTDYAYEETMAKSSLCEPLRTKLGISIVDIDRLINMNDSREWSFNSIADWIEETL